MTGFTDLGYARVDTDRESRQGLPEVVYGPGKRPEEITGIDLVQAQFEIAAGATFDRLGLRQSEVSIRGCALQSRVTTEDPADGFRPDAGRIVAFRAAGGAGIFLDVCDVLKTRGPTWTANSMAILFAPDVFDDVPQLGRTGVNPNALAALSELLAGYWNAEPPGETEFSLYAPAGIHVGDLKGRGPRFPFVIGRSNHKVHYGGQLDVYAGTASALQRFHTFRWLSNSATLSKPSS